MFSQGGLNTTANFGSTVTSTSANPMKDYEVTSPPDDSVSSLAFSPPTVLQNFLIAGSWDNNVSPKQKSIKYKKKSFYIPIVLIICR